MQLLQHEPELTEKLGEVPVAVIEKGKVAGAHLLSGANIEFLRRWNELFPDLPKEDWPVYGEVTKDAVYLLTQKKRSRSSRPPPNFRNRRGLVTSVSKLGRFLAKKPRGWRRRRDRGCGDPPPGRGQHRPAGSAPATAAAANGEQLGKLRAGVRRGREGDRARGRAPSAAISYAAYDYFDLHGADPMRWELGVKEVWEVPKPLDRVIHTMGWQLAAVPVADRQRDEHDPDRVRPHDRRGAEVRREQARGRISAPRMLKPTVKTTRASGGSGRRRTGRGA